MKTIGLIGGMSWHSTLNYYRVINELVAEQLDGQAAIDVPLLHIADAVAERARESGWSRLGVLGARWVMEEDFYVGRLAHTGLTVDVPGAADRAEVDRIIFDELTLGRV